MCVFFRRSKTTSKESNALNLKLGVWANGIYVDSKRPFFNEDAAAGRNNDLVSEHLAILIITTRTITLLSQKKKKGKKEKNSLLW